MKRKDFTYRLCRIVTTVGSVHFNGKLAHDCFCVAGLCIPDPVVDDKIIKFIEDAVNEKIKGELK